MQILFWGKVKKGAKRGKTFGFPTANIALHKKIAEGVYISLVTLRHPALDAGSIKIDSRFLASLSRSGRGNDKVMYPAATFIGGAKTFGENDYKAEVHILDFNKNIYGKWISIKLLKKIHENIKFPGEKELIKQMEKDVEEVRKYFTNGE